MPVLKPQQLRWTCDPSQFQFDSTKEVEQLDGILGQERALSAIEFGVGMRRDGYNLFVLGSAGSGKRTVVRDYLEKCASQDPAPPDWCYVNNFSDEDRPQVLQFPTGKGREFERDIAALVEELQSAISAALESEDHRRKVQQADQDFHEKHEQSLDELAESAKAKGLEMIRTPTGIALAPVKEGQVISPEDFDKLDEKDRKIIEEAVEELQPKLQKIVQQLPQLQKQSREKVKALNREATQSAIEHLVDPLTKKYADLPQAIEHIGALKNDVIEHSEEFRTSGEPMPFPFMGASSGPNVERYLVNLIVGNGETKGAPVIYEDHPYYHNLLGRIDHLSQMGSLVTSFSLIKSGALHRANGGYLVVQARDVLMQPFAWQALKRALQSRKIQIESMGAALSYISTVSLRPEPIDLDVKVVLLGDRMLYYLLQAYDPEFDELFKVAADFDDDIDCTPENCELYARLLATLAKNEETRPLDRGAVAQIIEFAARYVSDREKLSTHMRSVADLLREADFWADAEKASVIDPAHVRKAIDQQIYRSDRIRERVHEAIRRGTLMVETEGERVGQVNGLSVIGIGNASFGQPSRITATARMGRGKVVDIEREVELGGAIHSKGVMILSSLLSTRFARDYPLSFAASLVFEQSYGNVDGDSATIAEMCALLSALSGSPVRQNFAITGSMDQNGNAQPIGGVNEKIEGFFDVCSEKGLTGEQGVLIPRANEKNLMLRPDVVEAVESGRFSVHSYNTVDEALSILTGVAAGERDSHGDYPEDSLNYLVDLRLRDFAHIQRSFAMGKPNDWH